MTFVHRALRLVLTALAGFAVASCGQASAPQNDAATFYAGKTVTITVGFGAGGGYDINARLVSRHIAKHIPGNPVVVVLNIPGGGGLLAANQLYSTANKDGTVFGIFSEVQLLAHLIGTEGVQFDPQKFNWLGSSYVDPNVCVIRTDAAVSNFKDMIGSSTVTALGSTGPGSNSYDGPRVFAAATGANLRPVPGYPSTNEAKVGIERGEVQGMCTGWESIKILTQQWLTDGYGKIFIQNGMTRHKALQDVPLAIDFAKDEQGKALLLLQDAPGAMAKPFAMPPDVDPARVQIMRTALMDTFHDPAFLEEAKALRIEFTPKTSAEIEKIVTEILSTPPEIVAKYRETIKP